MPVEFRLLGDIEARVDGHRLDLGHARQRCVLAALLVDVNRPVTVDQLIDRVWADSPPHRARNALAGYLSRLRRQLRAVGDVRICREPAGYVLNADPQSVDLQRFRQQAARARAAEGADAARMFDEALALWRGEAFASLDTPWLADVRAALNAERFAAELDRNDVYLRCGRHGELLAELPAALLANPLDERLAGQLMLAQYRSGRQADALDTYRRMRERLVEELGVEPSPPLAEIHRRILETDDAAPAPAVSPAPGRTRPYAGLPRRATNFVGRDDEIREVIKALADGPLVTLSGVGGVGKTRLALEVADRIRDRFSDGVWICELAPLDGGAAVSHAVAAALRLRQQHGLSVEETVIEYLRGRELLLIVDNCEHVLAAAAVMLDQVVRQCRYVSVLATSREALGIEGERLLQVRPLPPDDATTLFADRARAARPDFDAEREPVGAVAEICRRLDGLPLAIELAAARMRMMSSLDVARRLDRMRLLSGGARGAHPRQQSLAATIDWSFQLLDEAEQALFTRLSVFAGSFDLEAAHAVCGEGGAAEEDSLELLTGLVDKSMVTVRVSAGPARYGMLETLRAYGRDKLREQKAHERYAKRHAVYFTRLAEQAAAGVQSADEREWVERMLPDYNNLRAAFEYAMADGDVELAVRLVAALPELVHLRVGYESATWAERTVGLLDRSHRLFPVMVGFVARAAWNRGDYRRAREFAQIAADRRPPPRSPRVVYPGDVLADVAMYEEDTEASLAHYTAELTRARREGEPLRLVWTLYYVAICYALLRRLDAARPVAEEAVLLADETRNPTARSMARYALGRSLKRSDPARARALFDEAGELAEAVQNFWWHGLALMEAAAVRTTLGDLAAATRQAVEALEIWDRVGDWSNQWLTLIYATRLLAALGANEDAVALNHAFVNAGRPAPLHPQRLDALTDSLDEDRLAAMKVAFTGDGAAAVAHARAALSRYC